jgi:hypothetical protein
MSLFLVGRTEHLRLVIGHFSLVRDDVPKAVREASYFDLKKSGVASGLDGL